MANVERLYLCNGLGCDRRCAETMTKEEWANYECHHTTDEAFAKTKVRRERKFEFHKEENGKKWFMEKP